MLHPIGIRREDKNQWERRVPLVPDDVSILVRDQGIPVLIQPSPIRAFSLDDYLRVGASASEDLAGCQTIFAVKEIPPQLLLPDKTYVFFSHVIKGQPYNMPMLRRLMDLGSTLVEYERIVDQSGRRQVFFGNYAGLAGMIDTLWALGRRLNAEGFDTPFASIHQASKYPDLIRAKMDIARAGQQIRRDGFGLALAPMVFGFAGYGNVSRGAQEIFDLLPFVELAPRDLLENPPLADPHHLYKVVFKEEDMVEPEQPAGEFQLQHYYQHPEAYRGAFERFVPHLTAIVNCIYWEKRYPRLVTRELLRLLYESGQPRLRVIGDISCDVEGSIEATVRTTDPGNPIFVYDPATGRAVDGFQGQGPVIMAIDNLPCELPRESSTAFSHSLLPLVPFLARADYSVAWEDLDLPAELKNAVIVHKGRLTSSYQYLERSMQLKEENQ